MPDKLIKIIQELEKGDTRRIDGNLFDEDMQQKYLYKAYVIAYPGYSHSPSRNQKDQTPDLIRIDIRRIK